VGRICANANIVIVGEGRVGRGKALISRVPFASAIDNVVVMM
jgi:hypothetical protein